MTNALNTPIEVLETRYPLRVTRYTLRRGSGGAGLRSGGDGLIREYQILAAAQASLLTERRLHTPWGLSGGGRGRSGRHRLNGEPMAGKVALELGLGDRLTLETPGGGGYGKAMG